MRVVLALLIAAVAAMDVRANSAVEFTALNGRHGRVENVGGGVWRLRLADADGTFSDRGAVQGLAAFMGESVPNFGAADGSRVDVSQSPFSVRFFSRSGRLVRELTALEADGKRFSVRGRLPSGEGVYGFGERLDRLNQRGQRLLLCSYDGWNRSDTTYAPMPFFVTTSGAGVFVNDYASVVADMGKSIEGEWSMEGDAGKLDLYVWATDRMREAVSGVHRLVGGSSVPPEWAAGPVVCRYWPDLTALDGPIVAGKKKKMLGASVKEMVERYEAIGALPKAMILEALSLDAFGDDEKARERHAQLNACGDYLRSKGVKMLVYMRVGAPIAYRGCGFRPEYVVRVDIRENGAMLHQGTDLIPDVYLNGVNPNPDSGKMLGRHLALDVTNPTAWDWYVNTVWKTLVECGVSGVKIDFCEELPDDGRDYGAINVAYNWHDRSVFEGMGVHHAYPAFFVSRFLKEMNRLTAERGGFMVLTRGGGIGSGRNPYLWAGDQMRTWGKLDDQLLAVLNSGMSGMPFMSYDMGGYQYDGWKLEPAGVIGGETVFVKRGKTLTEEEEAAIFARAMSFTAFMPCVQSHGFVRNAYDFGAEVRTAYARMQRMRDAMAPYFAKVLRTAAERGIPAVHPLVLDWQDDPNTYSISDEFMLGDAVLVAPLMGRGNSRRAYLPKGRWLDVASGKMLAVDSGGMWKDVGADVFPPPLFLNANASDFAALLKVLGGKQ